jgi:hypothetical protein
MSWKFARSSWLSMVDILSPKPYHVLVMKQVLHARVKCG